MSARSRGGGEEHSLESGKKKKEIRVRSENSGVYGVSPSLCGRWCELQNLKRSMKCWGETGVRQLSGSLDVQGCPES